MSSEILININVFLMSWCRSKSKVALLRSRLSYLYQIWTFSVNKWGPSCEGDKCMLIQIQWSAIKRGSVGSKGHYHGLNVPQFRFHPTFEPFYQYTVIIALYTISQRAFEACWQLCHLVFNM